jgi:cell wall-associated NlpC family hydrolase
MRRLSAVLVAAACAAAAAAGPATGASLDLAEIRAADGALLARAGAGAFVDRSDGGWSLRIGSASTRPGFVDLRDVTMLGGRVWAERVVVPAHGLGGARVEHLVVDGKPHAAKPNTLIPLGQGSYVVVLQEAVIPGLGPKASGVVGLRVATGDGRQILVGLARAAAAPPAHKPAHLPWLTLGVGSGTLPSTPEPALTFGAAIGPAGPAGPTGLKAALIAEQYLGVPYVWGGADPTVGFDCSGLMMYVYRQLGVSLPHFSGYQWYSGRRVPPNDLEPGDLVFFEPGVNGPGHVGMYIGGGEFVQAPHSGDVVRISSLRDAAYALTYVGAVRPY